MSPDICVRRAASSRSGRLMQDFPGLASAGRGSVHKRRDGVWFLPPPPSLAHARPCLSTGWALNRRFEEILGPLFLWSRMEDWVSVERL